MRALYPDTVRMEPSALRANERSLLQRFQQDGYCLIDICEAPIDAHSSKRSQMAKALPSLDRRLERLRTTDHLHAGSRIAVIGSLVHNVCYQFLYGMGFNVVNHKPIEFPAFGHQRNHRRELRGLIRRFSGDRLN